jgi:hypothetical protein
VGAGGRGFVDTDVHRRRIGQDLLVEPEHLAGVGTVKGTRLGHGVPFGHVPSDEAPVGDQPTPRAARELTRPLDTDLLHEHLPARYAKISALVILYFNIL